MTVYAETIPDIGREPLRRRDVNAMRLALEVCRRPFPGYTRAEACNVRVHAAMTALGMGDVARDIWDVLGGSRVSESRIIRARLALLLRVLLRVDACGDEHTPGGRYECEDCGSREYTAGFVAFMQGGDPRTRCDRCDSTRVEWTCAARPLWQDAPTRQR